jgi:hypothetical protein
VAKPKQKKTGESRPFPVKTVLVAAALTGTLGGLSYGYYRLRHHVQDRLAYPGLPPRIAMKNQPVWMSDALAEQIALAVRPKVARSAMDDRLLRDVHDVLAANPWVKKVKQVRRAYGHAAGDTLEIDAEYRAPVALVQTTKEFILVDGEGTKLPERFPAGQPPRIVYGDDGRLNLRIIEGVGAAAPFQDGHVWSGEDLQAGLDLVKLLFNQPYAEEIQRVNVANFKGRKNPREAQLVLVTKYRTEIRWGEPVRLPFHSEISPAAKLETLSRVHQQYGRIDANHSWLDIRLDKVTHPAEERVVKND